MIQLTRRERRLGIVMTAVATVLALYGFAIEPMRDRIETLQRIIPEKQGELREIQASSAEYIALRRARESVEARIGAQDSDFQLLPFLESLIEQHRLTRQVVTMERDALPAQSGYSETIVKIGFEGITLRQLVAFLEAVETSGVIAQIGSLHVRKDAKNETRLISILHIHSPQIGRDAIAPI
jgi:hypothetical protein